MSLTIGSCCSGIGGMDLGLESAGLGPTLFQIEINPFCQAVLRKHWPDAALFEDLESVDTARLSRVDILAAGTPCQNLSSAGDRSGLGGPKSRLFYAFLRVVRELRPAWVAFENVASGASRWVDPVRSHLAELGYATLPIQVAASDLGAPHIRSRVFVVANLDRLPEGQPRRGESGLSAATIAREAGSARLKGRQGSWPNAYSGRQRPSAGSWWSSEPSVLPVVHGLSGGLAGRYRRAAIRALGNSCSPAQSEVIGHVIRQLAGLEAS